MNENRGATADAYCTAHCSCGWTDHIDWYFESFAQLMADRHATKWNLLQPSRSHTPQVEYHIDEPSEAAE